MRALPILLLALAAAGFDAPAPAQEPPAPAVGGLRGAIQDRDFAAPLPGVTVRLVELAREATTDDQGNFSFAELPPGVYTLVLAKDGYVRQIRSDVVVTAGQFTEIEAALAGDFTDMEEFVVEDALQLGAGTEAAVLQLRFEAPALLDAISSDLMSQAGASDAAAALRLVTGATVKDGKSAVIRGLPDRYVSSQLNGVRLPTADEDKRAVELDQFPSSVIDSIQVSKTFTPDQQGDASGGAVDVRLKGVPAETLLEMKAQTSYNTQATGRGDFLTYEGGGVNGLGRDDGSRDIPFNRLGESWDGAVGVITDDAPSESKWSAALGGSRDLGGVRVGGFASFFYERDSSYSDNGTDDEWWVENPGDEMTPQTNQGTVEDGDFKTHLFDVTQGSESVQLGGLATFGIETDDHRIGMTYLYSRTAEDVATLAEDTRGKEYFFPGYDADDPRGTGNEPDDRFAAPWLRLETLEYTERTTDSLQLDGMHALPLGDVRLGDVLTFRDPELSWVISRSGADFYQPDKRQFGSLWLPASYNPGVPPFIDPFTTDPEWFPYKPGANFTLGNLQRIWKTIDESSDQMAMDLKLPFQQWTRTEGYLKTGFFLDRVDRRFDQDSFSNFNDGGASFEGDWEDYWSSVFDEEDHPITESLTDVDYDGEIDVSAWYTMFDMPVSPEFKWIGGARVERTSIGIVNHPEEDSFWFPPGATAPVQLNPGDADVDFASSNALPALGFQRTFGAEWTLRGSVSRTIARQTFKELTPIIQQEYLGGPVFIGNPDLGLSTLENYDLRLDFEPHEGALLSASWFRKDVENSIEYVQRIVDFSYTTAVNYPEGEIQGAELELRQDAGQLWAPLQGMSFGANATFIQAEVTLPPDEAARFDLPNIRAPMSKRDMTNAPEHIFNLFITYQVPAVGTQVGLFYTVQGDQLVAGAGESDGNFVPSVYQEQYDTLNLSVTQGFWKYLKVQFQAKNLTDPLIEEVYRSDYVAEEVRRSSYSKGVDYSLSITLEIPL